MLLHAKIYCSEAITTILCTYVLKAFEEQLNVLKLDDYGITFMEKFAGTKTDITLKNHHTWGCPVYVLDERFENNIDGITKWEPRSHAWIYLGHSQFHAGLVDLVLKPETGYVSPQFHVVFDNVF